MDEMEFSVEPEAVIGIRNGREDTSEILIKWPRWPDFGNTWESFELIDQQFPNFNLADKEEAHMEKSGELLKQQASYGVAWFIATKPLPDV